MTARSRIENTESPNSEDEFGVEALPIPTESSQLSAPQKSSSISIIIPTDRSSSDSRNVCG